MQGPTQDNMFPPSAANHFQSPQYRDDQQHFQAQAQSQGMPRNDFSTNQSIPPHMINQHAQFQGQMPSHLQSPMTAPPPPPQQQQQQASLSQQHQFAFQHQNPFASPNRTTQPDQSIFSPTSQPSTIPAQRAPLRQLLPASATSIATSSSQHFPASSSQLQAALLPPTKQQALDAKRTDLTTFEDPIAEAYIAGQTLDEPFYSIAPPGTVWPADGTIPLDVNLMLPPLSTDPNHPSQAFATAQAAYVEPFSTNDNGINGGSDMFDSAAAILDHAAFSPITEITPDAEGDPAAPKGPDEKDKHGPQDGANGGSTSASASRDAIPPRRRTRRRQNISCDQCRASKRGCDFQLRLDADGNDVSQGGRQDDDHTLNGNTGDKRKMSDAGQEASGGNKLVCSNCQRRGIQCTTNFADSVRESKQANSKDEPMPQGTKKRTISDDSSENGVRAKSVSTDGSSPSAHSSEARDQLIRTFQSRNESQILATTGPNVRFAMRADSLLLTTNRMRLYVHTVEPNANLWLSRACSPLRTDGDLGAYIKSTIGIEALNVSQRLWASWHVDAPSSRKEHQPNLFYLVYGLDHLGGEMGVWGEKPQQIPTNFATEPNLSGPAQEAQASINDIKHIFSDVQGMGPGGWRRSKRDLMIDEAVKAAMLAYACQFRLDDEMTSSSVDAASRKAADGKNHRDVHDRIATAAWKRARSLILQLAPRRSFRIAYGLFLFGVTAPPPGALTEGGARSGADAAEDAAFALETASRHLEWFVKRCRDLLRTVDKASKNPLLSGNPEVVKQRRVASDLMGLAESLGWFGLLIDTVTHVSQNRRSSMREDNLVYQSTGIGSGTDPGVAHGPVPSPGSANSPPDRTAEALFAMQDAINLLPARQAPPGAFPGTSESYMHEESEVDGSFQVETEMSRRIMERAACARDLIPALLRNPGALANAIPFDMLIGANDPDATDPAGGSIININNPGGGLNEQVVLLGVAWGTAVEVYIWRRVGVLQAATEAFLSINDPVQALVAGGGSIVSEKVDKMVMNVLEAIRLFHNIFDHLIARALDEFVHLSRQGRIMLSFFVIHIHLGVLHFTQLAKKIEQKELELIQAFNASITANAGGGSPEKTVAVSPMSVTSPTPPAQQQGGGKASPPTTSPSSATSPSSTAALSGVPKTHLRSTMLHSSVERRIVGRQAALGMARMASLINAESASLKAAAKIGRQPNPRASNDGKKRKGSFYAPNAEGNDFTQIEDSANAPWRHPYPAMVADSLKLSSQQLNDGIWDLLIAVPRNEAELEESMSAFEVLLEGFGRMLHAVPGLGGYMGTLDDLRNARDTARFVASQASV
ncbi:hypothetical protein NDA13_005644 [Ustilago tritici]|nr:hypothetical protein NDA13_005644 [Ustilago tritici]